MKRAVITMNAMLGKALAALVFTAVLFAGSVRLLGSGKTIPGFLQLLGAACLVVVALAHVAEAVHLFPWMQWGAARSIGHYLDLSSAVLGVTLFPLGILLRALHRG